MSQIFKPNINTIARLSIPVGLFIGIIVILILLIGPYSPYTQAPVGIAVEQPVRFSHELHSGVLNIECLYCHGTAEVGAYGGIPDTHTCMSCHSQIATYSELLEPVRTSYELDEPLVWNRVHDLADHVYFNHSIHVNKGFACETCHGRVDQMPLVWQAEDMTMAWCLDCHLAPEQYIRPVGEIYTFGYEPEGDQMEIGPQLIEDNNVRVEGLGDCWICHR
jgi:hypothetical protein